MKRPNRSPRRLAVAASAIAAMGLGAATALAGNIPQYAFSQFDSQFIPLQGAQAIPYTHIDGAEMLYPNGAVAANAKSAPGFPIGFDFRYAGQTFNQFAVNSNGAIQLGYDKVDHLGFSNLFFIDSSNYITNPFYMGMDPIAKGIKSGSISYKTEGEPGNRTLTVQFLDMVLREDSQRFNGTYSLQIVLREKDNAVLMNFLEVETPQTTNGLYAGLSGWDAQDRLLLTAEGIGEPLKVSPLRTGDMLNAKSYVKWSIEDELGFDHMTPYSYTLEFLPTGSEGFECASPANLSYEQTGDVISIFCDRPADAPATMILVSDAPFTEADLPAQGLTYRVTDPNNKDNGFETQFGNARLVYYGDDAQPFVKLPGVEPSKVYYVKAFGANGYPSYSFSTAADMEAFASHPAPTSAKAESAAGAVALSWKSADDVVVAVTGQRATLIADGTTGLFGTPGADCQVGDEIPGGGRVIYVGPANEFNYTDADPNRIQFFRLWALRNGRLSKTHADAAGLTLPSLPYEPAIEDHSIYQVPMGWTAQSNCTDATVNTLFVTRNRGLNNDERAVGGVSANGTKSVLTSQHIELEPGSKLSFEWAMETAREMATDPDNPAIQLPQGNKPGEFGMGHKFTASCGPNRGTENKLFEATSYNGQMTPVESEPDKNVTGTSEFLPVEAQVPENVTKARFSFSFSTEGFSTLYLRNIKVTGKESGVRDITGLLEADAIHGGEGVLSILSIRGGEYAVCTLDGRLVRTLKLQAGESALLALPKGIYVVGGQKAIVR